MPIELYHSLWLNQPRFLREFPRRPLVPLLAGSIYCSGLLIAAIGGVAGSYVRSVAFVMGSLGVAWVITSIRERARTVDELYRHLAGTFTVSEALFTDLVNSHFLAICNWKRHLQLAAVLALVATVAAWVAFFNYPLIIGGREQPSLRPWVSARSWYTPPGFGLKFSLVVAFALMTSAVMGTALWLMGRELGLLRSLRNLPPIPLAEVTRVRLRGIAEFHVKVASDWSLGALLFLVLFAATPDVFSVLIVSGLSVIALVVLLYPQVLLGRITMRAHERACDLAADQLHRFYSAAALKESTDGDERRLAEMLSDLVTLTARPKFWVYSFDELVRWSIAQGLVIAGLVYQLVISRG